MGVGVIGRNLPTASLQPIVNAIRAQLDHVVRGGINIYDTQAPPNLEEKDFPLVVFTIRAIVPETGFGTAPDNLLGALHVFHYSFAKNGAAELRAVEDQIFALLHRSRLTAIGYCDLQLRCLVRGGIDFVDESLFGQTDQYEIRGAEV